MIIFQSDADTNLQNPGYKELIEHEQHSYHAGLPAHLLEEHSNLIDELLGFAFDTLDVRYVVVHVREFE